MNRAAHHREIRQAGLDHDRHGLTVIPKYGKQPAITGWTTAKPTPAEIATWEYPAFAVRTGRDSGNLIVFDFDGLTAFRAFLKAFPEHQNTYMVATGSGKGIHVYFKTDILPDNIKAMEIRALDNNNIELMAEGKSVVAPPSIHKSGNRYKVSRGTLSDIKRLTIDELQQLINWLRSFQTKKEHSQSTCQPTPWNGNSRVSDGLNQAITLALASKGYKPPNADGWMNGCCILPGHDDKEASAGYNVKSGMYHCFRCEDLKSRELAEHLNIDWRSIDPPRPMVSRQKSDRQPVPTQPVTDCKELAPVEPDNWLTDGIRCTIEELHTRKDFKDGLPYNTPPFVELMQDVPEEFGKGDCLNASLSTGVGMGENSIRDMLTALIDPETGEGVFFDESRTLSKHIDTKLVKNPGRPEKRYRKLPRALVQERLLLFAEKRYRESEYGTSATAAITPAILEDIGLSPDDSATAADEISDLAPADRAPEHRILTRLAHLKRYLKNTTLTPLPADMPRHNGATYRAAFARAKYAHRNGEGISLAEISQEIGIPKTSVAAVFKRANIKRHEQIGQHPTQYVRAGQDIARQIARAGDTVNGKPMRLVASNGTQERILYLTDTIDPTPFARQVIREGYEVTVHCQTKSTIEVLDISNQQSKDVAPESKPRPAWRKSEPAEAPRAISLRYNPEWVRAQLLRRLILSQGGENPPPEVRKMPIEELLEYIVGRPLQWVERQEATA